ncbi:hypothetical protein N7520_005505 [Penicillium odoratum]|uniref:uncharacterized protein n=1 Tax=Penicillium odoratum TaxID=1167516 RepID=UPI002548FC9B|nr:uncharacterized protein N7520_005505 [Penicillium odoratum]KAJ5765946.1 hypothetical protein N7520_005505 [Penicillium odoratum]
MTCHLQSNLGPGNTMSGGRARHSACKYCRDHKVRCDGGQPSCEKCRRAGEECIYLPTQRPTRADLTQTVASLQKRLRKTTSLFVFHSFGYDCVLDTILVLTPTQGETEARISGVPSQPNGPSRIAPKSHPHCNTDGSNSWDSQPPAAFLCPLPSTTQHGYQLPSTQSYQNTSPGSFNDASLRSLHGNDGQYRITAEENEPTNFGRENGLGSHPGVDVEDIHNNSGQGQSYVDITDVLTPDISEITEASFSLPAPVPVAPQGATCSDSNISEGVAAHLADFSSAVFHTQAEIAGIALAVAEYITWMRKVPAGMTPPNTTLVFTNILETVEERLREIGEMAQTKPRAAFQEMIGGIQKLGPAGAPVYSSLSGLEEKFERQSADVAKGFSMRYNACALMSEQASNLTRGPATRIESH